MEIKGWIVVAPVLTVLWSQICPCSSFSSIVPSPAVPLNEIQNGRTATLTMKAASAGSGQDSSVSVMTDDSSQSLLDHPLPTNTQTEEPYFLTDFQAEQSSQQVRDKRPTRSVQNVEHLTVHSEMELVQENHLEASQYMHLEQHRELLHNRRDFILHAGAAVFGTTVLTGAMIRHEIDKADNHPVQKTKIAPVNMTKVARETNIDITMECERSCLVLDRTTFQKKRVLQLPDWIPPQFVPAPKVVKDIPNSELLIAAIVAGSAVDMTRNFILYPLQTLKTRIQTDIQTRQRTYKRPISIRRRMKIQRINTQKHFREGKLYAGIFPSLLVSAPATGVYYGVRDVTKRMLVPLSLGDAQMAVLAAFVGDVVSLMFRTPADTLSLRLQAATAQNQRPTIKEENEQDEDIAIELADALDEARVEAKVGNWFTESLQRLPNVIITDLPYLLSRVFLNSIIMQGATLDLARYEAITVFTAVLCGLLTTPFDLARTRILVDSDADPTNGLDGGSNEGLIKTFQTIMEEGDGGVQNLFAGWVERTAYLGISSLWLPLGFVAYNALRDVILLQWFD